MIFFFIKTIGGGVKWFCRINYLKYKFDTSDKSTKSMMKSIDINIKKLEDKKEVLLDKLLEGAITNDMFN